MSNNIGGKYQAEKKDPLRAFYPIIGLIVLAIAGAIGYFTAPYVYDYALPYIKDIVGDYDKQMIIYMFAFMIALVIVAVLGFVFAIFAPKPPKEVGVKALQAERRAIEMERKRMKRRKSAMRKRMKKGTKDMDDI